MNDITEKLPIPLKNFLLAEQEAKLLEALS